MVWSRQVLNHCPGNLTPDQNVYHARTHFHEERGNFSKVGAIREIKKRG